MADCGSAFDRPLANPAPESVAIQWRSECPGRGPADDQGLRGRLAALGLIARETVRELRGLRERIHESVEAPPEPEETGLWRDALDRLERAARLGVVLSHRMSFARGQAPELGRIDLNAAVRAALGGSDGLAAAGIEVRAGLAEGLWPVEAAAGAIERVVGALVGRAKAAMPEGGTLTVRTENVARDPEACGSSAKEGRGGGSAPRRWVCLVVEDTAHPSDGGPLHRIFEPLVRGAAGLPTLAELGRMVRGLGGKLAAEPLPERGASFRVQFPAPEGCNNTTGLSASPASAWPR